MFNLVYNKEYFDKYKYEKFDFDHVAFFLLLIVYAFVNVYDASFI